MRRRASFVTPAVPTLVVLVLAGPVAAGAGTPAVPLVESPLPAGSIRGIGGYVGQRFRDNQDGYLKVFDIDRYARMIEAKTYRDWWFIGEQPGKWLESAVLTSRATGDRALEMRAREVLARLVAAQEPGGYLGITDPAIRTDQRPLRGMEPYELYFLLHGLLTAAEALDDAAALRAAGALGDYLVAHIGPGKAGFWPGPLRWPENRGQVLSGHSELAGHSTHYGWEGTLLIDPMLRLYQETGATRYLDWSRWVVGMIDRWSGWETCSQLDRVADGTLGIDDVQPRVHANTFQLNFLGFLRLYRITGDASLLRKVKGAWDDITRRQTYITGGVSVDEYYRHGYIRPITGDVMETCATMSWLEVTQSLLELTSDVRYAEAIERLLFNQVFASQAMGGECHRVNTPPNGMKPAGYFRGPERPHDCCTSSGPRLISLLPRTFYALGEGGLFVNQFVPSTVEFALKDGTAVTVVQETGYPESETITLRVTPGKPSRFVLHVRIPAWCERPSMAFGAAPVTQVRPGSYARIDRVWSAGDTVDLELPMSFHWVEHDHYLGMLERKRLPSGEKVYEKTGDDTTPPWALMRGPLVYALDTVWWGNTQQLAPGAVWQEVGIVRTASDPPRLQPAPPDALGPFCEVSVRLVRGPVVKATLVPFANVGRWYRDPESKPERSSRAYSYAIWLPDSAAPGFAELVKTRRTRTPR
jgi:DUF1680 family protein